jgi:hypothetical protein
MDKTSEKNQCFLRHFFSFWRKKKLEMLEGLFVGGTKLRYFATLVAETASADVWSGLSLSIVLSTTLDIISDFVFCFSTVG